MVDRPFRSSLSMSAMSGQRAHGAQRHEGARERRQRRLCAEARVRYRLCRDAMLLATHRGGPVVGSSNLLRDVGGSAGVRGCLVGDCAPSLLLPCVVESVPEHDPVLVRYLLSRTLLDRETENKQLEKEKEDDHAVATPPSPVVGTLPAQSGAPASANVVFVTDISWHEARWNWYRTHAHSSVPDLSQFRAVTVPLCSWWLPAQDVLQAPLQWGLQPWRHVHVCTHAKRTPVRRTTAKFQWLSRSGAVFKCWAWYGGSGFGWPARRTGRDRVAGSLLAPGLPQAGSCSPSSMALRVGTPSPWCLCAGSTSPSCLCVGTGLGCRSTSSGSVASACCWKVCSRPGVSRHSLVFLCSLKRIFRYPLFTADRVRVFSRFVGPWGL